MGQGAEMTSAGLKPGSLWRACKPKCVCVGVGGGKSLCLSYIKSFVLDMLSLYLLLCPFSLTHVTSHPQTKTRHGQNPFFLTFAKYLLRVEVRV